MNPRLFFILFLLPFGINAQEIEGFEKQEKESDYYRYDQDYLPASFHKARREELRELLPDSTAAVFFSAPERNRSNDVYYEYHQDPNFYYLSGLLEPNSMLLISKEKQVLNGELSNEILLMQNRNPQMELWNGRRVGLEAAPEKLQIQTVMLNTDAAQIDSLYGKFKRIYFISPFALENFEVVDLNHLTGLFQHFKSAIGEESSIAEEHLQAMMATLRQNKKPEEIALLKKAIDITCKAQNQLMRQIDSSMKEYQTEAIIEYVFKSEGAEYTGFPSIQGSGENSCILHYTSNRRPLSNGGLLISDVGAEYHGYTADVTRTIPPDGKFSEEEAIIYNLVLKAQNEGIAKAQVGNSFWSPHMAAQKIIADGLIELGIIENSSQVRRYFMHGTSHYLGLDVHDLGLYKNLSENEVITVEPGIYIAEGSDCDPKWWNIGVRIEDDILISKEGPVNLSASSPRTIAEIEALMKQGK